MRIRFLLLIIFIFTAKMVFSQNYAFSFVAKTDVINIGDATEITPPWTAEMWVYRKANVPSNPGASVLLNGSMGKLNLETWNTGYKVGITYKAKYDRGFNYVTPINKWTHLAFVCNGNYTFLYVNGVKKDSLYHTMELPAINLPMSSIGLNNESPNANVDEIRVWNSARSSKDIQDNMNKSVDNTLPNLYGYWFADNQTSPATDISIKGRSCSITGATYVTNDNPTFLTDIPSISYNGTEVSNNSSAFAAPSAVTQEALLINVKTSGVLGSLAISQINCSTNGTTRLSDIKNARLYYTGVNKKFSTTSQFGTIQTIGSTLTFNGDLSLKPGNNYFWLTYDISSSAIQGDLIDGECTSVVVGGTSYIVSQSAADGSRIIHTALPASPNAVSIIPKPTSLKYETGNFALTSTTRIVAPAEAQTEANQIATFLRRPTGFTLPIVPSGAIAGDIILHYFPSSQIANEGYELKVYTDSISITASSRAGLYYGWQTLRQMFPKAIESSRVKSSTKWYVPCAVITDSPRFSYRGFMFDPARYYHSVAFTKKLIDHLSMQKINYLHWHLVDDQGCRFECAKYPAINSIGSWQSQCGNRGGYYTKEEMREIVRYAQDRHLEIIPEFEIPGHSQELLASLPVLKCTSAPGTIDVSCSYGVVSPNIMCGGQDTTYKIIENILLEYMNIFPSKYIHIGGDEAPKSNWDACRKCTAFKQAHGIANSHDLQAYMTMYFNNFLKKYGKRIIGWEEILDGLTSKDPIAQEWNNSSACYAAMKNGTDVIFSDASRFYIDMQQVSGDASKGFGYGWMGVNDLNDVYTYDPVLPTLTETEKNHVMGMEACLWGETLVDTIHTEYMMYPRLFAVGESMWSSPKKNYSEFYTRMANRMAVVDSMHTYHRNIALDPIPEVIPTIDTIYADKPIVIRAKDISENYYWSDVLHSSTRQITISQGGVYSVYYTIGSRMIENKFIVNMQVPNGTLNIKDLDPAHTMSLSPNPAKEILTIKVSVGGVKSIRILNMAGETLIQKNISTGVNDYVLSLSMLSVGGYVAEVKTRDNHIFVRKFIKE